MYRIGMFSKLSRVTIKTLHHYDDVGLLKPAYVDEENGYRYYTTNQLFLLNEIRMGSCQPLGHCFSYSSIPTNL